MKDKEYISKVGLKGRGWTEAMVSRFLPECDREVRNPHYACSGKMKLYSISRVQDIEASEEFSNAVGEANRRRERMIQAKKEKRQAFQDFCGNADLGIPVMSRDDLLEASLASYNGLKENLLTLFGFGGIPAGYHPLTLESDSVFLACLSGHYLRGHAFDYGCQIKKQFGLRLLDEGLAVIGSRVSGRIDSLYPWIKDTIQGKKRYLFIDTETTGLDVRFDDLVQVAWILTDESDCEITSGNFIVKPDGFTIPASATQIHGITTTQAIMEGRPLKEVLRLLSYSFDAATAIVGHNPDFDLGFLYDAAKRSGIVLRKDHYVYDTADYGTWYCQLPSSSEYYEYRTPSLTVLYQQLFGHAFDGAHNAMADAQAARRCYWELLRKNVIIRK